MGDTNSTNVVIAAALGEAWVYFDTLGMQIFGPESMIPGVASMYTHQVDTDGPWERQFSSNHPLLRRQYGPRQQFDGLRFYTERATAVRYTVDLRIKRLDLKRDKTGVVKRSIDGFYTDQVRVLDRESATEFDSNSGDGPLGYDEVALFSTSHPHVNGGSGGSNKAAATNLTHANAFAAFASGGALKQENGEPLDSVYTHCRVSGFLEQRAREIFKADQRLTAIDNTGAEADSSVIDSSVIPNVWRGDIDIIIDRRVPTSQNYQATLMDLRRADVKPMRLLIEERPTALDRTDPKDPHRWEFDEFLFGLEGTLVPIAGDWTSCYRLFGSA